MLPSPPVLAELRGEMQRHRWRREGLLPAPCGQALTPCSLTFGFLHILCSLCRTPRPRFSCRRRRRQLRHIFTVETRINSRFRMQNLLVHVPQLGLHLMPPSYRQFVGTHCPQSSPPLPGGECDPSSRALRFREEALNLIATFKIQQEREREDLFKIQQLKEQARQGKSDLNQNFDGGEDNGSYAASAWLTFSELFTESEGDEWGATKEYETERSCTSAWKREGRVARKEDVAAV